MKNLEKISRENLKSIKGSGGEECIEDPAFMKCYISGFPNGICTTRYKCCIALGSSVEYCKDNA